MAAAENTTTQTRLLAIEIIDIECGPLSRVSQKIVATKWRIYNGKFFCQIGSLVKLDPCAHSISNNSMLLANQSSHFQNVILIIFI